MEKVPSNEILNKKIKVTVLNKDGKIIDNFSMRGGANLWVFIRKRGLAIGSACSGVGVCSACCLKIKERSQNCISTQNDFEKQSLKRNGKSIDLRLSCLCRVYGDIEIQTDYW